MSTPTAQSFSTIEIPVSLPQIAEGLRKLSRSDLETLELLVDQRATRAIEKSQKEKNQGQLIEL